MDKEKHVQPEKKTPPDAKAKPAGKSGPVKHPGGRPSKLTPQLALKIFMLARKGLTDGEIAHIIDVTEQTINNWKKSPEFFESLKECKQEADLMVERSLFESALGYEDRETKVFCHEGKIITHEVLNRFAPNVSAGIFWLKNRQPDKWRDRIPELSNLADELGSVLKQLRRHYEKQKK